MPHYDVAIRTVYLMWIILYVYIYSIWIRCRSFILRFEKKRIPIKDGLASLSGDVFSAFISPSFFSGPTFEETGSRLSCKIFEFEDFLTLLLANVSVPISLWERNRVEDLRDHEHGIARASDLESRVPQKEPAHEGRRCWNRITTMAQRTWVLMYG